MHLKKRLLAIANMIDDNRVIYDVGCDHAYLDIFLALNRNNIKCYAIDVKQQIIDLALLNVIKNGVQDRVSVILNDGLNNIRINKDDIVVLAGLGTNSILKIIKNISINNIIIQSNDDVYYLRKVMTKNKYKITDEKIVYEGHKFYTVIKFTKGIKKYSYKQLLLGPILLSSDNPVFINFLKNREKYFQNLINKIPFNFIIKKLKMKRKLKTIKKVLQN